MVGFAPNMCLHHTSQVWRVSWISRNDLENWPSRSNFKVKCDFFAVFYHFSCLGITKDVSIDVNFAKLITHDDILGIFKECFCSHNVLLG